MPDKERKRRKHSDNNERPKKKAATFPTGTIDVELLESKDDLGPLLAVTPGLEFPKKIKFQPYKSQNLSSHSGRPELLLQSSQHPRLDYVAREECDGSSESQLQDYIGVFDPATNKLQLMPVRRVTLRSTLRSEIEELRQEQAELEARQNTNSAKRLALAAEFGSKKSKKALEARSLNMIHTDAANQNGSVAQSVLQGMATLTGAMPTKEELALAVDSSRPRPVPNLAAEFEGDVYPVDNIVGKELLTMLSVKEWVVASDSGQGVHVPSMFVAKRIQKLAKNKQIQKLKVLRFILLCLNFNAALIGGGGNKPKKIPQKGKLEALMGKDTPAGCVMAIRRKFAPESGGEMPRWNIDKLATHIAAAALIVDDFEVDMHDLREDLRIDNRQIKQYFMELGCRITKPTLAQIDSMKITKAASVDHNIAKLRLPLVFPQVNGPRKRRN